MIDVKKWNEATEEQKMEAISVIRSIMTEKSVTKADNALITDFLYERCKNVEVE